MSNEQNEVWQLKKYVVGEPKPDDFELVSLPLPKISEGQLLIKSLYLSVDPCSIGNLVSRG